MQYDLVWQRHNEALHELLGDKELLLTIETEDFPIMGRGKRLPAFSMCWGASGILRGGGRGSGNWVIAFGLDK